MPKILVGFDTDDYRLEESVDERRHRRTLRQHQEHAENHQSDHDRREPVLLIFFHELPEFGNYACFGHINSSEHLLIVLPVSLSFRVRPPVRFARCLAAMQWIPTE